MRVLTIAAAATSVLLIAVSAFHNLPHKLVFNGSASAPIGFYWVDQQPVRTGDYVLLKLPEPMQELAESRQYLPRPIPLIKLVAAAKGDAVCRLDSQVYINGKVVAHARERDSSGRVMPDWQGCYLLDDSQVFLLQPNSKSFDSRYFGVLDRSLLVGRAIPSRLPTWK